MSEEEMIKNKLEIIKKRLEYTKLADRFTTAPKISFNYILDMEDLLDLYNKEKALAENHRIAFNKQTENLKEIEELYNKEKEKNKTFKDKIIFKIEEVKKRDYNMAFIISGEELKQECIDVLKDLLEDKNA